ncbi:MAG: 50S ribosomal protein L32 [Candidatus Cloacimonetes bacterium]|jgi:large subunit ribosomal protein L32|nr:50S ribosomal protein L32 [Candidatus Cloacimonadota bacterium]MDY0336677.1 50S ribosomal protein L32 [Candidatus Cloacimonadaceae bacterium]MCB5269459.1 50S ribosomal protein L32 [Candidatus Cloacimonadota bacterium]MCK9333764.1 50S ribosomal protein L32 [Candidatus Cloacimonadota bacterium]MDD2543455.1 50S ribosomal protein L32 [Candidatus Cloacimonadota bacterium]
MAVPKRKTSKTRRDKRRTHDALSIPSFSTCAKCNEPVRSHHICDNCGTYNGRQILDAKE